MGLHSGELSNEIPALSFSLPIDRNEKQVHSNVSLLDIFLGHMSILGQGLLHHVLLFKFTIKELFKEYWGPDHEMEVVLEKLHLIGDKAYHTFKAFSEPIKT